MNYIGDGDSKTHKGVVDANPYPDVQVNKKEDIGHVQKRMGSRLRNLRKAKKLGGKGKLTNKLIGQLTTYYGNAIRGHCTDADAMYKAVWATFYHISSTDDDPQHYFCSENWCKYLQAASQGKLEDFHHKPVLSPEILQELKPVYEALSDRDLLERCIGGFSQNPNESFNNIIWKMAPKIYFSGLPTV